MSLINRLERRFGRFAIPNLTLAIVLGQGALYAASYAPHGFSIERLMLDPGKVVAGEVWRLITFLFVPPPPGGVPILAIFYFWMLYLFGTALERHWGPFRYTLYLFCGYVANVAAAFIAWGIIRLTTPEMKDVAGQAATAFATNGYLYGSIFLAFARLYPDFTMMLFFVLPVKVKWLAVFAWAMYFLEFMTGNWMSQLLVVATVANYLLFFGREHWQAAQHNRRAREFRASSKTTVKPPTHICRICGKSSQDSPRMLFRYCSKCAGQVCYCPDHIRNHVHLTADELPGPPSQSESEKATL